MLREPGAKELHEILVGALERGRIRGAFLFDDASAKRLLGRAFEGDLHAYLDAVRGVALAEAARGTPIGDLFARVTRSFHDALLGIAGKRSAETRTAATMALEHFCDAIKLEIVSAYAVHAELARAGLEAKVRDQMGLLGTISHDLRTPLNAILALAAMLEDGSMGPLEADQRECVHDIHQSGESIARLARELRDLSQLEAAPLVLAPQRTSLTAVLGEACDELRAVIDQRKLTVVRRVDSTNDAVFSDPARLGQVARALVSTAAMLAPEGGTLEIEAAGAGESALRLAVSLPSWAFATPPDGRPASLADLRRTPHRIGLILARRIAEAMGGRVELGQGQSRMLEAWLPTSSTEAPTS